MHFLELEVVHPVVSTSEGTWFSALLGSLKHLEAESEQARRRSTREGEKQALGAELSCVIIDRVQYTPAPTGDWAESGAAWRGRGWEPFCLRSRGRSPRRIEN